MPIIIATLLLWAIYLSDNILKTFYKLIDVLWCILNKICITIAMHAPPHFFK